MARVLIIAFAQAVPAEARIPARVVDPRGARHEWHAARRAHYGAVTGARREASHET